MPKRDQTFGYVHHLDLRKTETGREAHRPA